MEELWFDLMGCFFSVPKVIKVDFLKRIFSLVVLFSFKSQELKICKIQFLVACTTFPLCLMRNFNYVVVYSFFICHFNSTDRVYN